ncbi:MAG: zf-TFIIB domain-containing protein [Gemmatimonadota bacterium]|nr:zf-TFIIB domain-containing protein [Gemmatimonadota bacterium]
MTDKPSSNEEEYFLKQDAELVKQMRARLDADRQAAERKSHYMKCPKDGSDLREVVSNNVAIDVCDECGGMWLDRGELDVLRKVKDHRFAAMFAEFFRSLPGQ